MGSSIAKLVLQPPDATHTKDPNLTWLHTSEHEVIPAFFIDRDARLTWLFSHGNAEDLDMLVQYFREVSHILEAWAAAPGGPSSGTSERCTLLIIFTIGTCLRGGVFRNDTLKLLWPFLSAPSRCTLVFLGDGVVSRTALSSGHPRDTPNRSLVATR